MTQPRLRRLETKLANLSFTESETGADARTFEGYASVFDVIDHDGDRIQTGAFKASLSARKPAMLWQHDAAKPCGVYLDLREDERGLYVKGKLADTPLGREAYELLKMDAISGLSIGFVAKEAARNPEDGTRTITEADLMEISLVTFPANEAAQVTSVKAKKIETKRDLERCLRDAGQSQSEAKRVASTWQPQPSPAGLRDVGAALATLKTALKNRSQ